MKKFVLVSLLVLCFFLTGCGNKENEKESLHTNKEMHCLQSVSGINIDLISNYQDDVLSYLGLKYDMDLSSYSDIQIAAIEKQDFCTIVGDSMKEFVKGLSNCKQKVANKTLVVTADFNLDDLLSNELSKDAKLSLVKESLESENYTCTVK